MTKTTFKLQLILISVNFRFSFVLNQLAYITIPKNTGRIKINWNEKITYNIYKQEVSLYIYVLPTTDIF